MKTLDYRISKKLTFNKLSRLKQRRLSLWDKLVPRFQLFNKSRGFLGSRENVWNRLIFKISYILKRDNLKIILKKIKISTINYKILQFNLIIENKRNPWLCQKALNSVYAKLSYIYLCSKILIDKSAFSQATVLWKVRLIPMNS